MFPAVFAFLLGVAMLAAWFPSYWPGTTWTVIPRAQLIEKGRQVAQQFGFNVQAWKAYPVATVSDSLSHYGHRVSPLSLRISYVAPQGDHAAEVGFDSAGTLLYWRAPNDIKAPQQFASNDAAAQSAFQFLAGTQASSYNPHTRFAGDESREQDYEFKKKAEPNSSLRERIKVTTKDSSIERVDRKIYLSSSDEDDDDHDEGLFGFVTALFAIISFTAIVLVVGIFILWRVRKALDRKFHFRIATAAFLVMVAALFIGPGWDKMKSPNLQEDTPVITDLFAAAAILCFVAVGRGISPGTRPKWMSLEQLVLLAPIAKPTGQSLAAGLLFSPLLAAIPFLIAACGLFPASWLLPHNAELLYDRAPIVNSSHVQSYLCLLGFFGFGLPALGRIIRFSWLRWLVMLPIGIVVFSTAARMLSGPLLAPLTAGLLTLALFWFVWVQFDMLAILTLQLASAFVLSLLILFQNGETWTFILALGLLAFAAFYFYWRGQPIAEGDPLATNPMLTGFRAEREKLRAEFSIARRAQMDMLPQAPPDILGYSIAASCTPSLEVGGDLYDFLKLQDGRIGIGVADVSGKGVPAALYMTLTKGLLASVTKSSSDLASVVEEVNRHLHSVTRKKVFVTMALGFLDAKNHVLQYVRAGHNPLVWRQKNRNLTTLVSPGGLGLGITAGKVFRAQLKMQEMQLSNGDAVVFYSDGITEAMNSALEQFGEQRLMDAVDRTDNLDATAARDSILKEVRDFLDGVHPQDDMTLVVLRVNQ